MNEAFCSWKASPQLRGWSSLFLLSSMCQHKKHKWNKHKTNAGEPYESEPYQHVAIEDLVHLFGI